MAADREEQLLLRVQDADLAERLHAVLSERPGAPKDPAVELRFDGDILRQACVLRGPVSRLTHVYLPAGMYCGQHATCDSDCHAEDGEGRKGTFSFDGTVLPASLKDLPTIVECYKTYDDVNLVKTGDIGQVCYLRTHNLCSPSLHHQIASCSGWWCCRASGLSSQASTLR